MQKTGIFFRFYLTTLLHGFNVLIYNIIPEKPYVVR